MFGNNFTCTLDHIRERREVKAEQKVRKAASRVVPIARGKTQRRDRYFTPIFFLDSFPVHARSRSETEYCEYVPLCSFFPHFMRLLIRPMQSKLFPGIFGAPKFMDVSRRRRSYRLGLLRCSLDQPYNDRVTELRLPATRLVDRVDIFRDPTTSIFQCLQAHSARDNA